MRIRKILLSMNMLGVIALATTMPAHAEASFVINNKSDYYLNSKDSGAGCPKQIAPGATAQSTEYWCGFLACATKDYDAKSGCMEKNNDKSSLTEGGYATWFSISFGSQVCTVPDTNTYQCQYQPNGDLVFDYRSVTQKYSAADGIHQVGDVVTLPKNITTYNTGPAWRGINISGLEYDGTYLDALYQHPDIPDVRYFAEQGMNVIRLPIRWEFIVGSKENSVNSTDPSSAVINNIYMASVYDTVEKYLKSGMSVVMDLHNYMRFCATGTDIGQANEPTDLDNSQCQIVNDKLTEIWNKILISKIKISGTEVTLADLAKKYPDKLIFGLMNEPYTDQIHPAQQLKTIDLFNSELATVKKIRSLGIKNLILISGNYWDPLHGWSTDSPENDEPNGVVFNKVFTPEVRSENEINIAVEMHQYFDINYSGTHEQCRSYPDYAAFKQELGLDTLSSWIKTNKVKVFLGEFGAADNADCKTALNFMLQYVNENAFDNARPNDGGFIGWAAWRSNRHGNTGFSNFNYLQAADIHVYGANGTQDIPPGNGIVQGPGNGLMSSIFAKHLKKPN